MFKLKSKPASSLRHGLSLVEIMIAMVMTLIVLGAMMSAFQYSSAEMQKGRAAIELNNRLVAAESLLRADLGRITVDLRSYHQSQTLPKGYVELVEGARKDYTASFDDGPNDTNSDGMDDNINAPLNLISGDNDDFFAATIRSDGELFRARYNNEMIESHLAEVVWFTTPTILPNGLPSPSGGRALHRKLRLVKPSLAEMPFATFNRAEAFVTANQSVFLVINPSSPPGGFIVSGGTLEALASRGNRYGHAGGDINDPTTMFIDQGFLNTSISDNDLVLSDIRAFDIQVFNPNTLLSARIDGDVRAIADPESPVYNLGFPAGETWTAGDSTDISSYVTGAYIDLPMNAIYGQAMFDTGTSRYDRDNIPSGSNATDLGSNGVDDDGDGQVDEQDEKVSRVSYGIGTAIRGLKFTLRVVEPNTKQVRQLTVKKSFVAE